MQHKVSLEGYLEDKRIKETNAHCEIERPHCNITWKYHKVYTLSYEIVGLWIWSK